MATAALTADLSALQGALIATARFAALASTAASTGLLTSTALSALIASARSITVSVPLVGCHIKFQVPWFFLHSAGTIAKRSPLPFFVPLRGCPIVPLRAASPAAW